MPVMPRYLLMRLVVLSAAIGIYIFSYWHWLCILFRDALAGIYDSMGTSCTALDLHGNAFLVLENSYRYSITPACTYIDVFLILTAFIWLRGRSRGENLRRFLLLIVILSAVNFLRVVLAQTGHMSGVGWFWAHDVPDIILHLLVIGWFVWQALASDFAHSPVRL